MPNDIVAVDDGYAQIKVVGANPDGSNKPIMLSIRSSIRHGSIGSVSGSGAIATYETDDGATKMTVSDEVSGESTQFDGFHTSSMNRILIAHALVEAGYGGKDDINLWAGLPVANFFKNDESASRNDEFIAQKIANLKIPVRSLVPGAAPCPKYADVHIGCQALAAFIDYAVDDDFQDRQDVGLDRVAVVDIGGRTTDIAVVLGGQRCDPTASKTRNIGVLDVQKDLARRIQKKFEVSDSYSADFLDKAVRTGVAKLWGQDFQVSDLVEEAKAATSQKLTNFLSEILGSASNMDAVLFVGGGATLFEQSSKQFRNGKILDNPEFANARGLYKYAHLA